MTTATTPAVPPITRLSNGASRSANITAVAWVPIREMDPREWAEAGRFLGTIARCGQWGLGDWIRYGEAKFGERYTKAARITGFDVQTLMNRVYVASKFEISRRRENLSWSHHEALASLDPEEQDHWLDRAITDGLSVSDLRIELRSSRRQKSLSSETEESNSEAEVLICPHCGKDVPLPHAGVTKGSD